MINKKGELSTQQIVLIIILITSFAVILFFLFRLGLGERSEEQLCHNSVVQKASVFSDAPLQCYRDYICITRDGSCEGLIKPKKIKVKSLDETYETLANEMADCWWMFGEGKVEYVGKDVTKNNYCSICSQIYFDGSLETLEGVEDKKISKDELYNYLAENEYSNEKTYSEFLFGTNDLSLFEQESFGNIEIGKQYFNVMGITSGVKNIWGSGIGVGGVAYTTIGLLNLFSLGPPGWIAGTIVVGSAAATAGALTISDLVEPEIGAIVVQGNGIENQFMTPTIVETESAKFSALNCEEILTYA